MQFGNHVVTFSYVALSVVFVQEYYPNFGLSISTFILYPIAISVIAAAVWFSSSDQETEVILNWIRSFLCLNRGASEREGTPPPPASNDSSTYMSASGSNIFPPLEDDMDEPLL